VLFLNADGTVKAHQKINDFAGGFNGLLRDNDHFGRSVASLGDLDGDGVYDLAVGASGDSTYGWGRGAVWILFLRNDGTVRSFQKIQDFTGGFGGSLDDGDHFGNSVGAGNLDGAGVVELFVGAPYDDDGGTSIYSQRGAVWVLFLNPDGTVHAQQKISETEGGFQGALENGEFFGSAVAFLGDLATDGSVEVAVGAPGEWEGGSRCGAVWILSLDQAGVVCSHQLINNAHGGLGHVLDTGDFFGDSVACLVDQDRDGIPDLVVGAWGDQDGGGVNTGAVWILFLATDGTVKAKQKISALEGGFGGSLDVYDRFGSGVAALGDHDGDGFDDLAVGAHFDNDGGSHRGAVWNLFLQGCPDASATFRNPDVGGSTNPTVYDVTLPPILGTGFTASITTTGKTGSFLVGYTTPTTLSTGWGNLLVDITDPNGELLGAPSGTGDPTVIWTSIPDDPILCGFTCSTQAIRFGSGFDLTNAQDLVLGR